MAQSPWAAPLVMGVYAESMRSPKMVEFIKFWVLAFIIMRLRRDRYQHSLYPGYPYLAALVRWARNPEALAKALEPIFCLGVGMLLKQWSEPVGNFVAFGFVSLTAIHLTHWMLQRRVDIEIINAQAMGEQMSRRR